MVGNDAQEKLAIGLSAGGALACALPKEAAMRSLKKWNQFRRTP